MRFPEISRKFLFRKQVRGLLVGLIDLTQEQLINILTLYLKIYPVKGCYLIFIIVKFSSNDVVFLHTLYLILLPSLGYSSLNLGGSTENNF